MAVILSQDREDSQAGVRVRAVQAEPKDHQRGQESKAQPARGSGDFLMTGR